MFNSGNRVDLHPFLGMTVGRKVEVVDVPGMVGGGDVGLGQELEDQDVASGAGAEGEGSDGGEGVGGIRAKSLGVGLDIEMFGNGGRDGREDAAAFIIGITIEQRPTLEELTQRAAIERGEVGLLKADNIESGLEILEVGDDVGAAGDAGGGVGGVRDGVGVVGGDARRGDDRGEQLPTVPEGFLVVGRRRVEGRGVVVVRVGGGGVVIGMLPLRIGRGAGSAGGADRAGAARGATRRAVGVTTWAVAIPVR